MASPGPGVPGRHRLGGLVALILLASPAQAGDIRGQAEIIDGDTIRILNVRVRLWGIDAPEMNTRQGIEARDYLIELTFGHVVSCERLGPMTYGRPVCICFLPTGKDLAREMVKAGHAVDYPKFSGGFYAR